MQEDAQDSFDDRSDSIHWTGIITYYHLCSKPLVVVSPGPTDEA